LVNQDELQIERFTIAPALNTENIETEKAQEGETETVDLEGEGEQTELWSVYTDFLEILFEELNIYFVSSIFQTNELLIIYRLNQKKSYADSFSMILIWILIGLQKINSLHKGFYFLLSIDSQHLIETADQCCCQYSDLPTSLLMLPE
jgi:hypothetical protein